MEQEVHVVEGPNLWLERAPGMYLISLFDSPLLADAKSLVESMEDYLARAEGAACLVDLRHLQQLDPGPFHHVSEIIIKNSDEIARLTRRVALLHTGGLAAAAISGGLTMYLGNKIESKAFEESHEAFAWLGLSAADAAAYDERVLSFREAPTILNSCRDYIQEHLQDATLAECAQALSLDVSQLQNELSAASTSFRSELRNARLDVAKDLLLNTEHSAARIGEEVGYLKQQNFTDAFRKATGKTPTAWRKQQGDR